MSCRNGTVRPPTPDPRPPITNAGVVRVPPFLLVTPRPADNVLQAYLILSSVAHISANFTLALARLYWLGLTKKGPVVDMR